MTAGVLLTDKQMFIVLKPNSVGHNQLLGEEGVAGCAGLYREGSSGRHFVPVLGELQTGPRVQFQPLVVSKEWQFPQPAKRF